MVTFGERDQAVKKWWELLGMFAAYDDSDLDEVDLYTARNAMMVRGVSLGILDESTAQEWSRLQSRVLGGCN